jgi:hypothetical protein
MSSYEVARRYDNLLEQYIHVARMALDKVAPAPLPQGDTVPNSPVPTERVGNVLTDNEDEGQTPAAAPEDKGKGRDTQVAAREEAEGVDMELGDSEKENDPDHPGVGWMRYEVANPEHYVMWIPVPGELGDTRAGYIRYVFDGEDTTLEGTFGKGHPTYRQPLRARHADTCPNLTDNKDVQDNHLSTFNPESTMAEIIDRYVHQMADPRLIVEVVRYRAQKKPSGYVSRPHKRPNRATTTQRRCVDEHHLLPHSRQSRHTTDQTDVRRTPLARRAIQGLLPLYPCGPRTCLPHSTLPSSDTSRQTLLPVQTPTPRETCLLLRVFPDVPRPLSHRMPRLWALLLLRQHAA